MFGNELRNVPQLCIVATMTTAATTYTPAMLADAVAEYRRANRIPTSADVTAAPFQRHDGSTVLLFTVTAAMLAGSGHAGSYRRR
jgi:hypothetical protein